MALSPQEFEKLKLQLQAKKDAGINITAKESMFKPIVEKGKEVAKSFTQGMIDENLAGAKGYVESIKSIGPGLKRAIGVGKKEGVGAGIMEAGAEVANAASKAGTSAIRTVAAPVSSAIKTAAETIDIPPPEIIDDAITQIKGQIGEYQKFKNQSYETKRTLETLENALIIATTAAGLRGKANPLTTPLEKPAMPGLPSVKLPKLTKSSPVAQAIEQSTTGMKKIYESAEAGAQFDGSKALPQNIVEHSIDDMARKFENLYKRPDLAESVRGLTGKSFKTLDEIKEAATEVVSKAAPIEGEAARSASAFLGSIMDEASRIPSRFKANAAERLAVRDTIQKLPSPTARNAALDGVDVADINQLYKIGKDLGRSPGAKKLYETVRKFASGDNKINPIEVVGQPIAKRIQQLDAKAKSVGAKLGVKAEQLGEFAANQTFRPVFRELRKVPGLQGLKVSNKGVLDFTDTVLTTIETAADRKVIQRIFTDAVKPGTGKSKHLLRQELFEVLGGKKKAGINLTGTQEKAYQAVRTGLSNLLEGRNAGYKALSNEFRKIKQPLDEIKKFVKSVSNADEDIQNMSYGLLARRLTSNSASNPQVRALLRTLDNATKVKGKATLAVENLQDFYNILDKYYDIAAKTGFKGQIKSAFDGATGITDFLAKGAKELAGETTIVRQKALESLLEEILKIKPKK